MKYTSPRKKFFCNRKILGIPIRSIISANEILYDSAVLMAFIKWLGVAELDRNLYLTSRGDNLLTLTESFSCHRNPIVSPTAIRIWFKTGWTLTQPHGLIYGDFISRNNRNLPELYSCASKVAEKKCPGRRETRDKFRKKKIHFRRTRFTINYGRIKLSLCRRAHLRYVQNKLWFAYLK